MKSFKKIGDSLRDFSISVGMKRQEAAAQYAADYAALSPELKAKVDRIAARWLKIGAAIGLFAIAPGRAYAAKNLGDIASSVNTQMGNVSSLVGSGIFIGGIAMGASGISSLKKHSENPNDPSHTVKSGTVKIAGGSGLVGIGAMMASGMTTIFGDTSGSVKAGGDFKSLN